MYLRIKNRMLIITCNRSVKIPQIETFIKSNEAKILKNLERKTIGLYSREQFPYFGKNYHVIIEYNTKNQISFSSDLVRVNFKTGDFDEKYLESFYKEATLKKISELLPQIDAAIKALINIDNVTFKSQLMKSRFGSCIPNKRIIKLNSILARFDEKYLKAVLIHELIHLKVFGHQRDFYRLMDRFIPDYRKLIRELKTLTRKYEV